MFRAQLQLFCLQSVDHPVCVSVLDDFRICLSLHEQNIGALDCFQFVLRYSIPPLCWGSQFV